MIKIFGSKINIDIPKHEQDTKDSKATPPSFAHVESSYENQAANSAITSFGKSLVVEHFKPAKTIEELKTQINNTKWLKEENKKLYAIDELKTPEDIENFSIIWHKLDKLSPILQQKINPNSLIVCYDFSTTEQKLSLAKNFSVENINKLNPELQKLFDKNLDSYILQTIKSPESVNKLFDAIRDEYKAEIFSFSLIGTNSKEELQEKIAKTKSLNELDERIVKVLGAEKIIDNNLPAELLDKQTKYINSLPKEDRGELSDDYLRRIFENSYSFALNNTTQPICGTDNFVPFKKKEELKTELASMKNQNGEWMFSNDDINQIINNENDIGELSKILHAIKLNKLNLVGFEIKRILTKEGITAKNTEAIAEFLNYVQNNPEFKDLIKTLTDSTYLWDITKEDIENIKKNSYLIEELKNYNPEEYQKELNHGGGPILNLLKESKIEPETFKMLLSQDLFPIKLNFYQLEQLTEDENINNVKQENINFLKYLKHNPITEFLLNEQEFGSLSNRDIIDVLKMDLPDSYRLDDNQEMLKLVEYINSDNKKIRLLNNERMSYIKLLTKDDNFEDGKELIDFLIDNNIECYNSHALLTRNTFKENLELVKRINNIPILNKVDFYGNPVTQNYANFANHQLDDVKNLIELVEYANAQEIFNNTYIDLGIILSRQAAFKEHGFNNLNKDEIKKGIDKLKETAKLMSPEIWNKIQSEALETVLTNDKSEKLNYKKENIEYFNKFMNDERVKELFNIYGLNKLLQQDLDIESLNANLEDKLEFVKKYKDEIYYNEYVTYTGDCKKLEQIYEKFKKENPNEKIIIKINENTNEITIEVGNRNYSYDKNLNLIATATADFKQKKNGQGQIIATYDNKPTNTISTVTYENDPVYDEKTITHLVMRHLDDSGNAQKTKIYDDSSLDGTYNIKELYPDGKIKTISSGYNNQDSKFIEKHFESLDGTKSDIFYLKDNKGNEDYEYKVVDKDGNILLNLKRETKIIDENTKITSVNDKKYQIQYTDTAIKVLDCSNNEETILNLKELNPDNNDVLHDLLKTISGDELLKIKKYVKTLKLTKRIESGMDPISKTMLIGPHKFIFEHELGHAKDEILTKLEDISQLEKLEDLDRKITGDKKLQEIFEEEKRLLKENLPPEIAKEADYFINDTTHYGGKLGGLGEAIAETNAIQSTAEFHPLLKMRTQILQEYFPRTIAYLINNNL